MTTNMGQRAFNVAWIPSSRVEYLYYFVVFYSLVAAFLGIELPLVAAGTTVALAGYCYTRMGSRAKKVFAPIGFLLACTLSFILVQMVVHGVSITDQIIRTFILLICGMIIVQSLCLRSGFLRRCTIVLFAIGLIAVPYLVSTAGEVERAAAGVEIGGGMRNAGGLGYWFGFCLVSFAILGLEAKQSTVRILYWLAAIGCLFIVGLTVTRGALIASAIAITVGFRGLLRRGFVPVLVLIILTGVIFESGLFSHAISEYTGRGTEETGREKLWPDAIERILASPLTTFIGVGASNVGSDIIKHAPPHNSFLFFALSSGIVPFAFWVFFWIQAGQRSFSHIEPLEYGSFRIPFLLYIFVHSMLNDISTETWVLLTLCVGAGSGVSQHLLVVRRIRDPGTAQSLGPPSKAANL
jgi:hypothetical protein